MARLRIIAGPNGSGKSHLTRILRSEYDINWGYYINADDIERELREFEEISFADFGLTKSEEAFLDFYQNHVLREKAPAQPRVRGTILTLAKPLPEATYFGTLCADYIRQRLMELGETFSFETVMSGSDKLRLLDQALEKGYRIYLYFVCTEDPSINIDRVADRVEKQGHFVPDNLVTTRYARTLDNLVPVLAKTRRAYLFDNSGQAPRWVAEQDEDGNFIFGRAAIPAWFREYVLRRL